VTELLRVLPRPTRVHRRLVLLSVLPLLAACGSERPADDVPHPTGHGDVVLRLTEGPGMGTAQTFFTEPPVLVVTGDGTAYLRGEEVTAQGIVWPIFRFGAGEPAVQTLLHEADRDGLLSPPPDYTPPSPISDGGDTRVEVTAGGGHWVHVANGLSDTTRENGVRSRLADFAGVLVGWGRTPRKPSAQEIRPTVLRVLAQPAPGAPHEPVDRWPADATVDLADIGDCAVVRDPVVVRRLTTAGVRYYRQAGQTYGVAAAVLLPGDSCGTGPAS
jgi:hypothetical protein